MHPMRCLLPEMTSCPCCPRPALLPQSQHRGLHTGFQRPCCSWCHFLIGPRNQKTSNFPFTPSQARKRKPAWVMVALTRWSAAKHVGTGNAALGRKVPLFFRGEIQARGSKAKRKSRVVTDVSSRPSHGAATTLAQRPKGSLLISPFSVNTEAARKLLLKYYYLS